MNGNMIEKHKPVSLADQVYERLEKDILLGNYGFKEILTEVQLCNDLGVSRTPIREAVSRLENENLVISTGKGIMVLGITEEDLKDIFTVRMFLEPLVGRRCCENITDEELKDLKETLELQEYYVEKKNPMQIRSCDSSFHEKLYQYCGSRVIQSVLLPMHRKVQKFRQVSVTNPIRANESMKEHKEILEAIESRDPAKAEQAVKKHVLNAQKQVLKNTDK